MEEKACYEYRKGSRLKGDPQAVGERIASLNPDGTASPTEIVGDAVDPSSPLHDLFEWDDSVAAEAHRLAQARHVINSLVCRVSITETDGTEEIISPRCFYMDEGRYTPTAQILSTVDGERRLLRQARKELRSFRSKYAMLKKLAPVIEKIDGFLEDEEDDEDTDDPGLSDAAD